MNRFEADEKARKIAALERMIREFEDMVSDVDRQIKAEEDRTGILDPADIAYPTFAKSLRERRDNLRLSVDALRVGLEVAQRERDDVLEQLNRADTPASRFGRFVVLIQTPFLLQLLCDLG
jgi:flagellar protein FliJ